jgi:RHS repeat-associated protein
VATNSYLAYSSLVGQIGFKSNTVTRMTTSKQYDFLNRLNSISSTPSNAFTYQYNAANQRTMNQLWDGSYWRYGYDALGQVIQGNKYWVDETIVAGQQFDYTFDTIGNRTQTEAGGDQNGANLRVANYTNNTLNQITSRGVPAAVDVMGDGLATNGVTVNGLTAYRKNEYFRQQLSVTNSSAAVWDSVTVSATGQTSVTGHAYVAETPENYTYDVDGNLLSDGRWNYTWDGENRLVGLKSLTSAPSGSLLQLAFTYDYMGRRIQKIVSTNNGSSYIGEYTNNYAYDGWNCLAVMNPSLVMSNSFMWGSDLSGSIQGAGGVGGLIKLAYYGATTTNCFVAYDGNGNVSALINAADGTTSANYEYGPFGEVIRMSGAMAKLNPFRFSTKCDDDETDFLYYGYRYYNASTGRWLSRDPAEAAPKEASEDDAGGQNIYAFVVEDPINDIDLLGLASLEFKIVVGRGTYNSGRWSAPAWAGDGRVSKGANWAYANVSLLTDSWFWGNFCNTVNWSDPLVGEFGDAGSILVVASDCKGGTFRVQGTYTVSVGGQGPGQTSAGGAVYATAYLRKGFNGAPILKAIATRKRPTVSIKRAFSVDVQLQPGVPQVVLTHDAILQFPNQSGGVANFGFAEGKFDDVTIQKVQ